MDRVHAPAGRREHGLEDPRPESTEASTGTASGRTEPTRVDAEVNTPGPATEGYTGTATGVPGEGRDTPSGGGKLHDVRERWTDAQSRFVDDPRGAVREADALASEVADAVVSEIETRRSALRAAWNEGEGTDTESLRVALRDYRSFVEHLISEVR